MSLRGRRVMLRLSFWGKVLKMEKQRWVREYTKQAAPSTRAVQKAIRRA